MLDLPNRRPCVTEDVGMGLSVTVSYHPKTLQPVEVFMTGRGEKASDNPMTDALYNMGVAASLLMQEGSPYAQAQEPISQDNKKIAV